MNVSDRIKEARENLGMTQEDLAEKLEVSRQAVSKWELGASMPSAENLRLLEEALGVTFPPEGPAPVPEEAASAPVPRAAFWSWERVVLLVLGVLVVLALFSVMVFTLVRGPGHTDVPRRAEPWLTGISFFDENALPLQPELGDGWYSFAAGSRVLIVVEFQNGTEASVDAVSLFLTPAGTETYDQREQLEVQAVYDGRSFALFALDVPPDLMGHLDVMLESGGVRTLADTLNVTADPDSTPLPWEGGDGTLVLSATDITIRVGDSNHSVLSVLGVSTEDVAWISADPDIAGVSTTGTVWGVSPGVTTVTAEWNGQTAECIVRVAEADILTFERSDVGIRVGDEYLNPLYGGGPTVEPVDSGEAYWTSADPEIAEISGLGCVRGVSPGVTTITAERKGLTAEFTIHVAEAEE